MNNFITKKRVIWTVMIAVVLISLLSLRGGDGETEYDTEIAERKDLVQEISATGRVEAVDRINLAFEKSGRVQTVYATVGDVIRAGDPIVSLEGSELYADLAQAQALVESAEANLKQYEAALLNQQARLAELQIGTKGEEVQIYESKVQNAKTALAGAHVGLIDAMNDAYTRSEDAVRSKADDLFNNPTANNVSIKFTVTNSGLKNNLENTRASFETMFLTWKDELDILTSTSDLGQIASLSKNNLDQMKFFLENISTALNASLTTPTVSQATIDAWKVSVSAARTSVNVGVTNLSSAREKFNGSVDALDIAENELALRNSGSTPEQIQGQQALVQQAEANIASQKAQVKLQKSVVQSVEARLSKNVLRSPIGGIVTKQTAKKGALVAPNEHIATVISEGEFEIEALIVEADIVGLQVGDKASLTLDAYGDDIVFYATVMEIEPAADLVEGVASYRTTLTFDEESSDLIRAGMTADLDIVIEQKEKVVSVPQRAVLFKGGKKIVRVLVGDVVKEMEVETGITGERGEIEIVSGISEGDVVVTATKK